MKKEEKIKLFESVPLYKALTRLAIPMVLNSLIIVMYSIIDTYCVGLLNDPVQNAGITIVTPIIFTFNIANNIFGMGTSSVMSRLLGKKDYSDIEQCTLFGFYGALFYGILFSLGCYLFQASILRMLGSTDVTLSTAQKYFFWTVICGTVPAILNVVFGNMFRAEGEALYASIGSIMGCVINMILDLLLVMPITFNMGAKGAGIATFASNCIVCVYYSVLLWKKQKEIYISLKIKNWSFNRKIIKEICIIGVPAAIQNILNVFGMTILNVIVSKYGEYAIAGIGIAQKINMIPLQIVLGVSQGIMPLIGYTYSAKNFERMKKAIYLVLKTILPLLACVTIVGYIMSYQIVGLFIEDNITIYYGAIFLKALCISIPFMCMDSLVVGILQALGMGKISLFFALMRKLFLEIPLLFLLNLLASLYGVAYVQLITESIMTMIAIKTLHVIEKKYVTNEERKNVNG